MAIVPDLSGTRPGRPGNVPLTDPRNRGVKERQFLDDDFKVENRITLVSGNQLVLSADKTRNSLLFVIPDSASTVYVSSTPLTAAAGIPIQPTVGLQLRGGAAELAYYVWGAAGVVLSIFEG